MKVRDSYHLEFSSQAPYLSFINPDVASCFHNSEESVNPLQNLRLRCLFSRCRFSFLASLALLFQVRLLSPRFSQKNFVKSLSWRWLSPVLAILYGVVSLAIITVSSLSPSSSDSSSSLIGLLQELNRLGAAVSGVGAALRNSRERSSCELNGVSGGSVVFN